MAYLILVRHGASEYNEKGIWTGWDDPNLTEKGIREAGIAGSLLKDIPLDIGYTSALKRTTETLSEIEKILHREDLPVIATHKLNERNYGDYTGKNKWEIKKEIGEEEFLKLRRSWDYPVPNGESLKQVYEREIPYFESEILPRLKDGENVIIVSSGNALRALVKYLDHIPDDQITGLEIGLGEIYVYQIDTRGKVTAKEIRAKNPLAGKI